MATSEGDGIFHVYRGGIQGGWEDHEVHKQVNTVPQDYIISKTENSDKLKIITEKCEYPWDSEIVRIIFDRGSFKIYDIIGEIEPPKKTQCPAKTLMTYGSSITHGSNSIDASNSWAALTAHNLKLDLRNLGMAGSCHIEPEFADYIAAEGKKNKWDILTLELGINVLDWDEEKINERVRYIISTVAKSNKEKPIFVISPFYHCGDDFDEEKNADKWRRYELV